MDKYPHDGKGAPPPYAAASSRHSGPRRRHVSPIDAAKHVGRKEKRKDLFRCRINDDVLFQVPDPQHSGSSRIHDSHPDPSLEVHASTLECLIAAARSCSYFAAQRLYPDEKVIAHQIVKRETGFGIGPYETCVLHVLSQDPRLDANLTYQRCLDTCRDATEATIQLLTEALKRYEEDPAILWSLWMHQSVSFGWESATVLRKLEEWSNAFPPSRQAGGVWDEATVEAKMAAARKRLRPRARDREMPCNCAHVNLANRPFRQRLKDLFCKTRVCSRCQERNAFPKVVWAEDLLGAPQSGPHAMARLKKEHKSSN